jgi:predicted ATPase
MGGAIEKLAIEGFKSIRKLENFELHPLNVLAGARGAGKSNFVSFFSLAGELIEKRLQTAIAREGGADACLFMGAKATQQLIGKFYFGSVGYEFALSPTADNRLVFGYEQTVFGGDWGTSRYRLGSGHFESALKDQTDQPGITAERGVPYYVYRAISRWVIYRFHNTDLTARVRRPGAVNDHEVFHPDGSNLAAFLFRIQSTNPRNYARIRDMVRLAAPFFHDFNLRPALANPGLIELQWTQKDSANCFSASQLSDSTLRFICLATALLQPCLPPVTLFDEPELGVHPRALTLLANLFQRAARKNFNQVIVSTQSAALLKEFAPEDVIVVDHYQGESTFRRLQAKELAKWLKEFICGELWQTDISSATPYQKGLPQPSHAGGNQHP